MRDEPGYTEMTPSFGPENCIGPNELEEEFNERR